MRERSYDSEPPYSWIVYAVALLVAGLLAGYLLASQANRTTSAAAPAPNAAQAAEQPATSLPPVIDEGALRAYRDILERDPKNAQAALSAGNLLYDAHRYVEAIPFYQQAFALKTSDINVSTDLGTALWYAGRTDEALAQYSKSLTIDPTHSQTLFNIGIVKADGQHDYVGAVAAWETLLATTPGYPNAGNVRSLIADARQKFAPAMR